MADQSIIDYLNAAIRTKFKGFDLLHAQDIVNGYINGDSYKSAIASLLAMDSTFVISVADQGIATPPAAMDLSPTLVDKLSAVIGNYNDTVKIKGNDTVIGGLNAVYCGLTALNGYVGYHVYDLKKSNYTVVENINFLFQDLGDFVNVKTHDSSTISTIMGTAYNISDLGDGSLTGAVKYISTEYLTKKDASTIYLAQNDANTLFLTQADASNNYVTQSKADNSYITKEDAHGMYVSQTNATARRAHERCINRSMNFLR